MAVTDTFACLNPYENRFMWVNQADGQGVGTAYARGALTHLAQTGLYSFGGCANEYTVHPSLLKIEHYPSENGACHKEFAWLALLGILEAPINFDNLCLGAPNANTPLSLQNAGAGYRNRLYGFKTTFFLRDHAESNPAIRILPLLVKLPISTPPLFRPAFWLAGNCLFNFSFREANMQFAYLFFPIGELLSSKSPTANKSNNYHQSKTFFKHRSLLSAYRPGFPGRVRAASPCMAGP
jgi:hypothetical protein